MTPALNMPRRAMAFAALLLAAGLARPAAADHIAGTGSLEGTVTAPAAFSAAKVFAHLTGKNITYVVFTAGGRFSAVNVMPGTYEVWVEEPGFASEKQTVTVVPEKTAMAQIALKTAARETPYVGSRIITDRKIEPFDKIYPPGPGREILTNTCFVCHGWNFLSAMPQSREGWGAAVDYMTTAERWGVKGNAPFLSTERLPAADREVLLDYLAKNLGPDAEKRIVMEEKAEPKDETVLGKAMYIQYDFPKTEALPYRVSQETSFDTKGNVWVTQPRKVSAVTWLDPRTGAFKDYPTPDPLWAPHGIATDADDSVWFAALKVGIVHLDPKTGNFDTYGNNKEFSRDSGGLTPFLDSKGNVYWTDIRINRIGRWDRKTETWKQYVTPSSVGSPYGMLVDHQDKVWYAEFHACSVVRFDPDTETFKVFKSPSAPCLIRRPGLDSKGNIWYGAYDRGRLERLDPATGKVTAFQIPVPFATPYDTWVDPSDNVWTSSNNYFVKLEPQTGTMSYYPTPQRTDMPKMTITREGAVWFTPRGYGDSRGAGGASVLYPDKAKMKTFAAYVPSNDPNANGLRYKGPPTKVVGTGNEAVPGKKIIDDHNADLGGAAE